MPGAAPAASGQGFFDAVAWPEWMVWLLAVFGLCVLFAGLWDGVRALAGDPRRKPLISILLLAENSESVLEDRLARLVGRCGRGLGNGAGCEIVVLDCGSRDGTSGLLRRLERRYRGVVRVYSEEAVRGQASGAPDREAPPAPGGDPVNLGLGLCAGEIALLVDLRASGSQREEEREIYDVRTRRRARDPLGRSSAAESRFQEDMPL